nr:transposase [Klebsiella variicola]
MSQQSHILPDCDWQHITFTMPHLLWPFFNNNWPLLNALFRAATRAILRWARKQGVEVGIFCALHTYGRQLNQHPHIHLSVTRGGIDIKHGVWRDIFFKKHAVEEIWRGAVTRLLRHSYNLINPGSLPGLGISAIRSSGSAICRRSTDADGRSILRRRPAEPGRALNIWAGT